MNPLNFVLCLLYILSPIDFVPDFIPILGWIDDFMVASYIMGSIVNRVIRLTK